MTTVESGLTVGQGSEAESGVCLTGMTDKELTIVDYALMKDSINAALDIFHGKVISPGNGWHDEQYDTVKAKLAELEAQNPTWKEQYESESISRNLGEISNG